MNHAALLSERLLSNAVKMEASDIHFFPFQNETKVYFRINGVRTFYDKILNKQYEVLLTYYKFTSGMDIGEIRKPQNGTIMHQTEAQAYALRLSTLPVNKMESLAIRILPQKETLSLEQLFLFRNQLIALKQWTTKSSGIILFTGPTGSGKTTTLYALLQAILKETSYQTITLEDPIEKTMNDILQVQVNEKAGITYYSGLKAALRHDPDIIMVGEIRDRHTATFAFEASLTGHLVLSTLHAKDTVGTIYRLLEMGVKASDLHQSLIGIASLQLVPVITNHGNKRRAAIMELLDGELLEQTIQSGANTRFNSNRNSFQHIRKKAFAYGFITKETYNAIQK